MAQVGPSARTAFASNKALSINLQMTANPSPDKALRCSVAPTKIRLSLEPPPPSNGTGKCFTFWFVTQSEDPVRLELHRLGDGIQMVKYGDNPLSGKWSWRVPLRMSIESEFKCHFALPGFEDGRWFYFEQIGKSPCTAMTHLIRSTTFS